MLTRRSKKGDGDTSKNTDTLPQQTIKTPVRRRRSKSRSVESRIRTRSKSANKKPSTPKVIVDRIKTPDKLKKVKRKISVEIDTIHQRKSPTPIKEPVHQDNSPFVDKINNDKERVSESSKLEYQDTESDDELELKNYKKVNSSPVEFGGPFGNLILTILLPILVILAKIALKNKGNLIPFPRGYLRFSNYYDQDVFIWSAAIVVIQLLISLVPFQKKTARSHGGDSMVGHYWFSGFVNLFIGVLIVTAMNYYKCPISFILELVTKKSVPHVVASVLYTLIIAIILYVKAKLINKSDASNFIQNFFIGTTNNPTLGPINLKLALYRYSVLMTILLNYLVLMESFKVSVNMHLNVVAGLQIFYAIDKLIFEFTLVPSFYIQKEKDGYWTIIQQFLQPVVNFLPIQVLLSKNLPVNYVILGISSVLFLIGYGCQRYSDFIKYKFGKTSGSEYRHFGLNGSLAVGGSRSNLGGLWSYVKHPNYIGTIVVHLALTLPMIEPNLSSLQLSWPVFLYPLYYIVTLSYRCIRISRHYQLQYGSNYIVS